MLFRKLLFLGVAAALGCAGSARAQLGVYATVTGERVHGITCLDPQGQCASSNGTIKPYGTNFGAFYDFRSYGPALFGVDLRGEVTNSNKRADLYSASSDAVRHYAALGGLRASFKTPYRILSPYAEVAGGFARSNLQVATSTSDPSQAYATFGQVEGLVGIDLKLFSILDVRAIEFGAGEMLGSGNHSIESIGAGVVFHFPR